MNRAKDIASETADEVASQVTRFADRAKEDVAATSRTVGDYVSRKGADVADAVSDQAHRAARQVDELVATGGEKLGQLSETAKEKALTGLDALAAEVRNNPMRSLAVALGVGILFGLMSRPKG